MQRRYPIGAEIIIENKTHFRVWAPKANVLEVVVESSVERSAERTFHSLTREPDDHFSGTVSCGAGTRYRFRLNGSDDFHPFSDSRLQPEVPHGNSCVVDSFFYKLSESKWRCMKVTGQVNVDI